MTKPDKKKRVKININVPAVVINILEEIAEEVIEDIKEAVLEVVEEKVEHLEESSSLPPPPTDEEYDDENSPVSPCAVSKKRVRKVVEPKPLRNEKGEYLNPKTNRYVKSGTSAFKQLVKDGVIVVLEEMCV